jgi:uncharacterized protein (TIGR01777 family)
LVRIVIAGGSGFLGLKLTKRLTAAGHTVAWLTRRVLTSTSGVNVSTRAPLTSTSGESVNVNVVRWKPDGSAGDLATDLEGVDAVVNLAGDGIADKRWTAARKEALRSSLLLSTRTLVRAIAACATPPRIFVSGSGAGYYGAHGDQAIVESTPPGSDFLARVCVEWEQEARAAESPATRVVIVRTGLALDGGGGALKRMLLPFKLGLGATVGSGDQFMSWIHVDDWTGMVEWLISDTGATGVFNATAPAPVTNREFTRTLAHVLGRPAFLVAPAFVLQLGLGDLASALLTGQRVLPACAEQHGFRFTYRTLEPALRSLNL